MGRPDPSRVAAHPAGARSVIPEPRRRWIAAGAPAGGWLADDQLQLEFQLRPLWIAAPVQVLPARTEHVRVTAGRLGVTTDAGRRIFRQGDVVEIAARTRHTLWNAGFGTVRLVDEYRPPLRTAARFDELFTGEVRWRPGLVRSLTIGAAIATVVAAILGVALRRRR